MRFAVLLALALVSASLAFLPGCGGSNDSAVAPPPTLELTADTPIVNASGNLRLQWISTNANTVVSLNFGATGVTGTCTLYPSVTKTYSLTVQGPGGTASAEVSVEVFARDDVRGVWTTPTKRYEISTNAVRVYNVNPVDASLTLEYQYPVDSRQRAVYNEDNTVTCEFLSGSDWIPSRRYGTGILGTLVISYYYSTSDLWSAWQELGARKP